MCGNTTPFYKIEYNVDHQREAPTQIDMYLSNLSPDHSQAINQRFTSDLSNHAIPGHISTEACLTVKICVNYNN